MHIPRRSREVTCHPDKKGAQPYCCSGWTACEHTPCSVDVGLPENNSFSAVWRKGTELGRRGGGNKAAWISQEIIHWTQNKKPFIFHHLTEPKCRTRFAKS